MDSPQRWRSLLSSPGHTIPGRKKSSREGVCWPPCSPSVLPPQTRSSSSSATSSWIPRQGRTTDGRLRLSERLGVAALLSCDRSPMRQSSYVAEAPLCLGSCCGVCVRPVAVPGGATLKSRLVCGHTEPDRVMRPHGARAETGPPRTAPGSLLMSGQHPHRAIQGVSRQAAVVRCRLRGLQPLHLGLTGATHAITLKVITNRQFQKGRLWSLGSCVGTLSRTA